MNDRSPQSYHGDVAVPFDALALIAVSSFVLALVACREIRVFAERRALVDHPNERSLHKAPVPRLGGVGIFIGAFLSAGGALFLLGHRGRDSAIAWLVAAPIVALLGLVDDLKPLSASVRIVIQMAVSAAFCLIVGLPEKTPIAEGVSVALPAPVALAIWVVLLVAVLNIYNFMDGMDGLAGAQATGAGIALAIVFAWAGHFDLAIVAIAVAAASAGFFVHNAPPAKIFMGDAGSTFLGFTFAALGFLGARRQVGIPITVVPIALAPFLFDGTFTILRRLTRGEAIWKAHRSHLYQRAVGTGLSHHDVLVPYAAWISVAAGAAVLAKSATLPELGLLFGLMLLALGATWRWVVSRERSVTPAE